MKWKKQTMTDGENNIDAAMKKVIESTDLTIKPIAGTDDGPANSQVLIRTTDSDKERWRLAAESSQLSLSAWIRNILNDQASKVLDCSHPKEMMKIYPWSEICTKCGKRFK